MIDVTGLATTAREFPFPPMMTIISIIVTSVVGIIALSASVEGYFKRAINPIMRIVLAAGALLLIAPELKTDIIGIAIVGGILGYNTLMAKRFGDGAITHTKKSSQNE